MDKVMTISEAAREAEVSEKRIRQAIANDELPAARKGQMWLIDGDDLAEWITDNSDEESPEDDGDDEEGDEE